MNSGDRATESYFSLFARPSNVNLLSHVTVTHAHTHLLTRLQFLCFLLQHLASAHALIHLFF